MAQTLKDLYKQMGLSDSQVSSKGTVKKDTWKGDLLKPLSVKKYGRSYDDKLKNVFGGDEWKSKDFERFMDYRGARDTISKHKASEASRKWEEDHAASIKKQQEEAEKKRKAEEKKRKEEASKQKEKSKKKEDTSLLDDLKAAGKFALQGFNPFDDVSMGEAFDEYTNRNTSKAFDEIARGSNRAVDSASFGAMSNLDKKVNDRQPYYQSERKFGEGGGTDMITTGLGYLVPGVAGYKALNASKAGQALTKFGTTELAKNATKKEIAKAVSKRLASEAAKGATIGAGMSGAEIGIREGLNPKDQNWKDNLSYFGMSTALGAVADPALYGLGKGIAKGSEKHAANVMKGLLPENQAVAKTFANTIKADTALPIQSNRPNPSLLNDLLPTSRDIANPNYMPSVLPKSRPQVEVPTVGRSIDDVLANPNMDAPNPSQVIETPTRPNTSELPINRQEPPVNESQTPLERPENIPYREGERKHYSTLANSEKAPDEFIDGIKNLDRKISNSLPDKDAVEFANRLISRDIEEAFQYVKNADIRDKRHVTTGARLIDEFNKTGQFERAVDMADVLAKEGTKFGQGLQSFSLYNRLTTEGQLIRAQRKVIKLNETLPEGKKVSLTPEIVDDIVAAADSIQKFTGQQEIGSNVISLLDKAKKGNILSDEELKVVQSFMSDAKKLVGDLEPKAKPPKVKPVKDVRSRDKVVEFLSKQEIEAKKRIEARRNRANSLPVDIFYDYAVIGASKIAKGAVKFSDFSEQMIKDLGDEVKPYLQQLYKKAVENFNVTSEKITPARITQAEKLVNKALNDKTLSAEVADELMDLTKRLVNAAGDTKFEASMELQVALNRLEQPSFAQMIASTHYQAMLLNPLTIMRNIIGNEVFYRVDRASKLLAVPIDATWSKLTGRQRTIVFNTGQFRWDTFFNPMKDYGKGMKLGAKAGWKGVNPLGLNTAYDIKSPAFSSNSQNLGLIKKGLVSKFNPLHWTEKLLGVTMRSFDTAGYMRAYNQALREQATLKAVNEGLKGRALREAAEQYFLQADENMIAMAQEYGKYATFQDNTALSRALTKVKEGANELSTNVLTGGLAKTKEFGAGSFIMPFPKTPANLVMRSLEYSPAGIIRSVNLLKNYFRNTKNPLDLREGQIALTRAIMGTVGFSGLGYILADRGVLTSAGDSDYKVRELEKMSGKQPNSVNITAIKRFVLGGFDLDDLELKKGDTFVSYDWAQPIALSVSLGTGINQAYKESEDPTTSEQIVSASDSAINTIVNMSSLSGINRLVSGPPNETWSEKVAGSMQSAGGSFIPTVVNQTRKKMDNTVRNTYAPTFGEKFVNTAKNRIPEVEKELPPSYNTFGEKRELYPNKSNNILNVFLNPSYVNKYNPTPEAKFLLDYITVSGDKSAVPTIPKSIKVEGKDGKLSETVPLTGKEHSEYQRIVGEELKKGIKEELSWLKTADQNQVEEFFDDLIREAGNKAREAIREGRKK